MTGPRYAKLFSWNYNVSRRIFALGIVCIASTSWKTILGADSEFQKQTPRKHFPLSVTYHNKYLTGQVFQRLHSYDWLQCLTACVETKDCISYNLDAKLGTCELNSGGITELDRECKPGKSLKYSQHLIFNQMKDKSFWSPWELWSPCSATCGNGEKRRTRLCIGSHENNSGCDGPAMEEMNCNNRSCEDDVDNGDEDDDGDDDDDDDGDDDDDDDDNDDDDDDGPDEDDDDDDDSDDNNDDND